MELRFPFGGNDDDSAFSDQSPDTSRDMRNMRGRDRVTNRMRGAKRCGTSKLVGTQISGANPVVAIQPLVYDNPDLVTYAALTTGNVQTVWSKTLPSFGKSYDGDADDQENIYLLDGPSGIAKYNSEGVLVWKLALPIKDPKHEVRSVSVDPITLDVFVGVGTGGSQDTAALWCARQLEDDRVEIRWELITKAYTQQVRVHQPTGSLYVLQNRPDRAAADVVVYGALTSAAPVELLRVPDVPYPARCITVKDNGDFYVGSEGYSLRGIDPKAPGCGIRTTWWRPKVDFTDYASRVWAHWDATKVNGLDSTEEPQDGDEVLTLFDISGNDRHLYAASQVVVAGVGSANSIQMRPPLYTALALGGLAGVSFRGKVPRDGLDATKGWFGDGLVGLPNNSAQAEYANAQRGAFPGFLGGSFAVVALIRPRVADTVLSSNNDIGAIFALQNTHTDNSIASDVLGAFVNRQGGASITLPGTFDSGCTSILDERSGAAAAPADDNAAPFSINNANALLLSFIYDAQASGTGAIATNDGKTFSLVRVNGNYLDRYYSPRLISLLEATVGFIQNATTPGTNQGFPLAFELLEMVVIGRKRTSSGALSTTEPIVLSHPTTNAYAANDFVPNSATATTNELELWEGYLAHRRGVNSYLKATHPWFTNCPPATGQTVGSQRDPKRLASTDPMVTKYSATGDMVWCTGTSITDGLGLGIALFGSTVNDVYKPNSGNTIVCMGQAGVGGTGLRAISDAGESFSSAWTVGLASGWTLESVPHRIAVDESNNSYFPGSNADAGGGTYPHNWALKVYNSSGTPGGVVEYDVGVDAAGVATYAVVIPEKFPRYKVAGSPNRAEYAYLFGSVSTFGGTPGQPAARKVRLVTSTVAAVAPRLLTNLAVSAGSIKKATSSGVSIPLGASTLANPVLASTGQYVSCCFGFGLAFFVDGKTPVYYDPWKDELRSFVAKGAGKPLERPSLVTRWRGRLGFLRGRDAPQTGRFSRVGAPFDHDTQPAVITPDQAFDAAAAPAFAIPDVINGFIPASDDLAYVLCDSTVHRITGDPMAGGQIHPIASPTGGAFGKAWCKDGNGNIYFYGSRGGVWMIPAGGFEAVEITSRTIAKRMRQIDLGKHYVIMEWAPEYDGLAVVPVPFANQTPAVSPMLVGWFWERKVGPRGAWQEDTFNPNAYPTALAIADGDAPGDRSLLVGCSDGYIRKWDPTAKDDDGYAIDGYVTWGPFSADDVDRDLLVKRTEVILAGDQDGAVLEWFASDSPDRAPGGDYETPSLYPPRALGVPEFSAALTPGHNQAILRRARGGYLWLRLRNAAPGQSFALEKIIVEASPVGRRRRLVP